MIKHKILSDEGIVVVEPSGPLSEEDFTALTTAVDAYLVSHASLKGLVIHTRKFPGWEDLAGFVHHLRFVKDHHQKIERLAVVSDSVLASIMPQLAEHFVHAEIKHFDYEAYGDAMAWIRS